MAPRAAVNSSTIYSALRMVRRWAGSSARPAAGAVPDVVSCAAPPNGARHSRPVGGWVWPDGTYRRWLPRPQRWYVERRCHGISSEGGLPGHVPATSPPGHHRCGTSTARMRRPQCHSLLRQVLEADPAFVSALQLTGRCRRRRPE